MGIFGAFYSGISGLNAQGLAMSVIGNNIANINTVGFKGGRAAFADLLSQSLQIGSSVNSIQIGLGSVVAGVQQVFTQGSLQTTSEASNVAIQGNGFFVVNKSGFGTGYTRAGNFSFDKDGFLINPAGFRAQGWNTPAGSTRVNTTVPVADIRIPGGLTDPPKSTTILDLIMNLNRQATPDNIATAGVDAAAQVFNTSIVVYDTLGAKHTLNFVFQPQDTNADGALDQWGWAVTVDGGDVVGGTAGRPYILVGSAGFVTNTDGAGGDEYDGAGNLSNVPMTFNGSGQITAPAADVNILIPPTGSPAAVWRNGALTPQTITWDIYEADGSRNITGYASSSSVSSTNQDGFSTGQLTQLTVNDDGLIVGIFTNGKVRELAKLAIASFNNPRGLVKIGNNIYVEAAASGPPSVGEANTGGRGSVAGSSLELANVDIAEEFTSMIVTERGYQANSRVITTTDEMIQEALTLKR